MPKRPPFHGFAIAELVMVLAMLMMLVTLLVAIALGASRTLSRSPGKPAGYLSEDVTSEILREPAG